MDFINAILEQYKHTAEFKKGNQYFDDAYVGEIHIDYDSQIVRAEVDGARDSSYSADVRFAPAKNKTSPPILRGFCTCTVGFNCKHVFATILTLLDDTDPEDLERLYPIDLETQAPIETTVTSTPFFETMAPPTTEPMPEPVTPSPIHMPIPETVKSIAGNRLFFVLEGDAQLPPIVDIQMGNFADDQLTPLLQPVNIHSIFSKGSRLPTQANENDKAILEYARDHLVLQITKRKTQIRIQSETGAFLLQALCQTNRLFMRDNRQLRRVQPIPDEPITLEWQFNHKQQMRLRACMPAHNIFVHPLPTRPTLFTYMSPHPKTAGEPAYMGQIANLSEEQVLRLREQPWYDSQTQFDVVPDELKELAPPLPELIDQEVTPTPVITINTIQVPRNSGNKIAVLDLKFDYLGEQVTGFSKLSSIVVAGHNLVKFIYRDKEFESQFFDLIRRHMQPIHQDYYLFNVDYPGEKAFWFGRPEATQYKQNWVQFIAFQIPLLEAQGAIVNIDKDLDFTIDEVEKDSWFMEVEPDTGSWFDVSLGFKIDNEVIDLLPILIKQFTNISDLEKLVKDNPEKKIPIEVKDGRFVFMEANRLQGILQMFSQLFEGPAKNKTPKIAAHHANTLYNFYEEFDANETISWQGNDQLKELGQMLVRSEAIPTVTPSANLKADLREYQGYGISWLGFLSTYHLSGILADDMGLGKTLQTLAHLQVQIAHQKATDSPHKPTLIVCPTSVVSTWIKEAEHFTPDIKIAQYYGAARKHTTLEDYDIIVTSYGVIRIDCQALTEQEFHYLVLDEAQAIKNPASKTAHAVKSFNAEHRLCLTGTPIENHLGELWSMFDFLMPGFLGNQRKFNSSYRKPIELHGDADKADALKRRIAPFILRRTKDVVAKDLPPKTEMIYRTQLSGAQRDLYETIRIAVSDSVKEAIQERGIQQSQIVILDAILKLRQICCHPALLKMPQAQTITKSAKLDSLMDIMEPLVEEGRSLLLFSSFASMLKLIAARLDKDGIPYLMLTGQTKNRQKLIEAFQAGEAPVFLISLKAGGTGLTLTKADTVIHYDPWWNPAVEDQATDRAYRIGQDKPVFVYKMITESTIEEKMLALKETKKALAQSIYSGNQEGKSGMHFSAEDIDDLFAPI